MLAPTLISRKQDCGNKQPLATIFQRLTKKARGTQLKKTKQTFKCRGDWSKWLQEPSRQQARVRRGGRGQEWSHRRAVLGPGPAYGVLPQTRPRPLTRKEGALLGNWQTKAARVARGKQGAPAGPAAAQGHRDSPHSREWRQVTCVGLAKANKLGVERKKRERSSVTMRRGRESGP